MKPALLRLLACPDCQRAFTCRSELSEGEEVITGELRCEGCGATYPVRQGIPRILPPALSVDKQKTAAAFGWEWLRFSKLHDNPRYTEQFLDWIAPLSADSVRGKVVLDAGCGMGRFAQVCHELGADTVVGIDLSDAVEAARDNTRALPNVHIIQSDIYHLPFRRGAGDFDFVYSIGVLHHLPDPAGGFHALVRHLKPGGMIFGWVYGYEGNEWYARCINPIRRHVTSRLPPSILYLLSGLLTIPLHLLIKLVYAPAERCGWLAGLRRRLPYPYLFWLSRFGFRHTHHVIHDQLGAPTAAYLRRSEFEPWFGAAGLENIAVSPRNANSWRGFGCKPVSRTG